MKKMHKYLYLLLLVGPVHIDGAAKDYSEMSTAVLRETLMEAVRQNNEDIVSNILAHPAEKSDHTLRRALEVAAENNRLEIAHKLIQAGADLKDQYCYALERAAEKGYIDMVKALLPVQGCDKLDYSLRTSINYFNGLRDKALIGAAKNGHVDVMKELISAGANVNYQSVYGEIALVEAAKKGHVGAVKELLRAKANVNACDRNGDSALIIARRLRNIDLIRELETVLGK
jgi:ankyrin repeat protein